MGEIVARGKKKTLTKTGPVSRQMELFTDFFGTGEYSNTADLWDSVPKHCITPRRQSAMRDQNGRLPVFEHSFEHSGVPCRMELLPALIKEKKGGHRDYYPSTDEELVEEVLRKFFSDQRFGMHDVFESESWVRFTVSMIRSELKARGKTRSEQEVKRSLDIMALSSLRIYLGNDPDPVYTESILSNMTRTTRQQYMDDGKAMWIARLPALVSKSVNDHTYRQFNYGILMGLRSPFSRYLHKRLSRRYTNASLSQTHNILFSSLQRDSGMLTHQKISVNIKTVEKALEELVAADVLMSWKKEERRGERQRLKDVKFTMNASLSFIGEMRKMNERHKQIDETFVRDGLTSPTRR